MPTIQITTVINASVERCFNLSRSIDFHMHTSHRTKEKAIAGITKGLIKKGERVTWKARHFGIMQTLTSEITQMEEPVFFEDCMVKGAFKSIRHMHTFEKMGEQTIMKDVFEFEAPFGFLGTIFNRIVLTNYMKRFLLERNQEIKRVAEFGEWKKYLNEQN
jgi:ligand-binding SRPBCC domain-containing protein